MKFTIDRFEGEFAIVELENKDMVEVPRAILPIEAKEGDSITVLVDEKGTNEMKKRIREKFENLFCEE